MLIGDLNLMTKSYNKSQNLGWEIMISNLIFGAKQLMAIFKIIIIV